MPISKIKTSSITADAASVNLSIDANTLFLDVANNRVGVNTTSPSEALQVNSSSDSVVRITSTAASGKAYNLTSGGNGNYSPGVFAIRNVTDSTTPFAIFGDNVGIGTTGPGAKLHVVGADGTQSNEYNGFMVSGASNAAKRLTMAYDNANDVGVIAAVHAGTAWKSINIPFGNLGLGTANPGTKLDVNGSLRSDNWLGRSNTSAPTADAFIYRPADNTLVLGTANTDRIKIDAQGGVGINGTPGGATLRVYAPNTSYDAGRRVAYFDAGSVTISSNSTNYYHNTFINHRNYSIGAGVTDSGYRIGLNIEGYNDNSNFAGTLNSYTGIWCRVGNYGTTTGTINNLYGVYIENFSNSGTITNNWGLYQDGASTSKNYFAGGVNIGSTGDQKARLYVQGSSLGGSGTLYRFGDQYSHRFGSYNSQVGNSGRTLFAYGYDQANWSYHYLKLKIKRGYYYDSGYAEYMINCQNGTVTQVSNTNTSTTTSSITLSNNTINSNYRVTTVSFVSAASYTTWDFELEFWGMTPVAWTTTPSVGNIALN